MFKIICNLLMVFPALISLILKNQLSASAQSTLSEDSNSELLDQINSYSLESKIESRNQVANVNQLRDVSPTDWAYEALRSLVDRYSDARSLAPDGDAVRQSVAEVPSVVGTVEPFRGSHRCISGFPHQTYRGDRALSRYEFAPGLSSCLDQIERLIASSEGVVHGDIDTIRLLSQEFEAELATIGGRVDEIESRTAFFEDNSFSTTTKLEAEVVFAISGEFNNTDLNQIVFQERVHLNFVSSFFGEDALYTRFDAANAGFDLRTRDGNGDPVDLNTGALTYQTFPSDNDVSLGWLAYYFSIGEKIDVYLPVAFPIWVDFVPSLSPYLDDFTGADGSLSSFAESSPIYKIGAANGGGVGFNFNPTEIVTISAGYFGGDSFNPLGSEDGGLFNEEYSALGQVTLNLLDDKLQIAGTYVLGQFGALSNEIFDLSVGTADAIQPFGEGTKVTANSYGVGVAFQPSDSLAFNAFGMYTDAQEAAGDDDAEIWSYGAGLSLPDLGKEGNLAAVFVGAEPYLAFRNSDNLSEDVPIHIEALYKHQLNDNIAMTPGIVYIINPNGGEQKEEDSIVGVLRTTFSF
ncbi:MAG: iron uptake porin [Cyanobacteria bacterium P01_G01_bin.39]